MAIFHCYVSSPEGKMLQDLQANVYEKTLPGLQIQIVDLKLRQFLKGFWNRLILAGTWLSKLQKRTGHLEGSGKGTQRESHGALVAFPILETILERNWTTSRFGVGEQLTLGFW